MNNWREVSLGDLASSARNAIVGGPFGSNLVSNDYTETGVPVIRGQNMQGRWIGGDFVFVSEEKARSLSANLARPGDLVFTQRGTLGQVSMVPAGGVESYVVSQSQMKATIDPSKADVRFLYYFFISPEQQDWIRSNSIQTGVPHTNLGILKKHSIPLPTLREQTEIADVLGSLDDKIEQNRRTGAKLEGLARAVFRAWFVDFEPVKAKAAGATAFPGMPLETFAALPDRFTDSELGPVPEGWEVKKIRDLCSRVENGGTPKRQVDAYWSPPEVPWLTSGEVRQSFVMKTENFISKAGLDNSSAKLWPRFTTVVALYGATAGIATMLGTKVCANQACCGLLPMMAKCFVHQVLSNSLVDLQQRARGSAQQNLSQSIVADFECVTASNDVLQSFERFALPLYETCMHLATESAKLAALRDYLLPRLLSGRVRANQRN